MIVIVVKKLRRFIKGQFWWNHHQNARAKEFEHPLTANGIAVYACPNFAVMGLAEPS
jgi:hypothetical protein